MTQEEVLHKLIRYCDYQDRCHQEVRTKLLKLKVYGQSLEEIISELIALGHLNEERFARNYARGKFRIKHWGKQKIISGLKAKNISPYSIKKALEEVDREGGYRRSLSTLLEKYVLQRKDKYSRSDLWKKTYSHGLTKGYETALVSEIVKDIFSDLDQ